MTHVRVIPVILSVLGVSLAIAYLYGKARANQSPLAVGFVGITNDVNSGKMAIFTLSNTGNSPINMDFTGGVELRSQQKNRFNRAFIAFQALESSQKLTVKVAAPRTQDQWRVAFCYYPLTLRHRLGHLAAPVLNRFGVHVGYPVVNSTVHSEWMDPTEQIDWIAVPVSR